jgi:hypothetical protein
MDGKLLASRLDTSVVTIVGWFAAHQLAAWPIWWVRIEPTDSH